MAGVRLFQTAQQQQSPPGSSTSTSDYCQLPENTDLPECADAAANQASPIQPFQINQPRATPNLAGSAAGMDQNEISQYRQIPPSYRVTEQPTEFQKYVQTSIGRMLPIYGAWLFDRVPSTFAPVDRIPVTQDYVVGPGDEVTVRVWGQINFNQRLTVDRAGEIFIPQVGPVQVAGLKFSQLQGAIQSAISRIFKNFDLNVNLGQLRSIQIFVVGQARRPGSYTVSSLSSLVNAIFSSGGPSNGGSMRHVQLKRDGKLVTDFDLYDLLLNGDKSKDAQLLPGDVIFFPMTGPQVAVAGSVQYPAIYELKDAGTLGEVLRYAGGLSPLAAGQRAILERVDQRSSLRSQNIGLTAQDLTTPLMNGDIVRLLPLVPRFTQTVTLRGNVADPGRFPWHEGMKISDLIPDKESLLTRDYWREHNRVLPEREEAQEQQSSDVATSAPIRGEVNEGGDASVTGRVRGAVDVSRETQATNTLAATRTRTDLPPVRNFQWRNDVQPPAPDIDWDYAVIERLDPRTLATSLVPFNLGKVVLDHDASADIPVQPGDIITIFSTADIGVPRVQQTKYVRLEGEIKMAGVYSVHPGESLRDVVARAGGLTGNAYLYGSEFTRESTRREQQQRFNQFLDQLERDVDQGSASIASRSISADQALAAQASISGQRTLIDRLRRTPVSGRIVLDLEPESAAVSALPPLPLEDGDRLFVPSRPFTVNVVGTVYNQSAFLYASDLRLGDYIREAGGPTRFADRAHIFVIRADGSVVPREGRSGLFTRSFDSLQIYPGDSVVVPTYVNKTTLIRNFIDWSTVIGNFALGAAAVNVLK